MLHKIAITGPESTGKSEISKVLAMHYNTVWAPEFAREYLENRSGKYEQDDLLAIARGQLQKEREILPRAKGFYFADTEMTVLKIWSEVRYGSCDPQILQLQKDQQYDLYLLMDIDLPWNYDPLREHPHFRKELFEMYLQGMKRMNYTFEIISGKGKIRINNAIATIERHFPSG